MIVEDALKAAGNDDASIKVLVERALIEAKGGLVKDPEPGSWSYIKAVPQDQAAKTECIRAAMAAIVILESLHKAEVKRTRFPQMFKCLYEALAQGFVQADPGELKEVLARVIRSLPTYGLEKEWAAALYAVSLQYYDGAALCKFVAESNKDSNRVAISKTLQRRAGIMEISGQGLPRMLFEARCGHALGRSDYTLGLVEANVIAYIKRMAQLAEWSLMTTNLVHLDNQKVEILYPDTIKVIGDLNRHGSTLDSQSLIMRNLNENHKRLEEAWDQLERPDEYSPCIVKMIVDGVTREVRLF